MSARDKQKAWKVLGGLVALVVFVGKSAGQALGKSWSSLGHDVGGGGGRSWEAGWIQFPFPRILRLFASGLGVDLYAIGSTIVVEHQVSSGVPGERPPGTGAKGQPRAACNETSHTSSRPGSCQENTKSPRPSLSTWLLPGLLFSSVCPISPSRRFLSFLQR